MVSGAYDKGRKGDFAGLRFCGACGEQCCRCKKKYSSFHIVILLLFHEAAGVLDQGFDGDAEVLGLVGAKFLEREMDSELPVVMRVCGVVDALFVARRAAQSLVEGEPVLQGEYGQHGG